MFPEIPDIFPKYLASPPPPPKCREIILSITNIVLKFFHKYHDNDFINWSETSFIDNTGMRQSLQSDYSSI